LGVRALRPKKAENSKKEAAIEAKLAGEATLTPPPGDYRLTNSIARQKLTRSVEIDRKGPYLQHMRCARPGPCRPPATYSSFSLRLHGRLEVEKYLKKHGS
jgi:hypothetical protein